MKEHFAGELKMLRVRLEALDLCFKQKDPELIKHFIGRFSPVASPGDDNTRRARAILVYEMPDSFR